MHRGELAKRAGCHMETVRYYEKIKLLDEPPRKSNGYRDYGPRHERQLKFIIRSRELGFSIENIKGLLGLVNGSQYSCNDVRDKTNIHLLAVNERIKDLQKMQKTLKRTIANCDGGDTPDCAIIDALLGPI